MRAANGARTTVAAVVAALLIIFAGVAYAAPLSTDFRVSNSGIDQDTSPGAFNPDVAYNSQANQYLAVWYGDGENTFEYEIYGQLLDANGNEVAPEFRISSVGPAGNLTRVGLDPAVAYNSVNNEYLVIWYGNHQIVPGGAGTPVPHFEVWGQRLAADGTELGTDDFRISTTVSDVSPSRAVLRDPEVAYNPVNNRYLAVWASNPFTGPGTAFDEYEISGQLLSNTGADIGSDFRISNTGTDGDPARDTDNPVVAANTLSGEYMVAWYGNPTGAAGEYEIHGQVLNGDAGEVGADFRISNVGVDGNGLREPGPVPPSIAYNSLDNQFLVAWYGNDLPTLDEYEIWGQRMSPAGAELGADFRISNVGTDGGALDAFDPSVAYDSVDNEYLVAWYGDTGSETEICGQRVSAGGAELGGDFRLSNTGTDGDTTRGAFFPATTFNSQTNEYLATWYGDGLVTDDEFEVFARRLGTGGACATSNGGGGGGTTPPPPPSPPSPPADPKPVVNLVVKAASTQKALRAKAIVLRASCDLACTVTASASLSVPGASKTYRLPSVKRSIAAGKTVTLKLKLSAKTIRAAKRALAKRKTVRATVSLRARDAAGGLRRSTKRIRIKR